MATTKDIEVGAKAIAKDMLLPGGGRKKLARVVEAHLDWFEAVEARGLTMGDVSRLLFTAGATTTNGRPISLGTLSSAIWRKRKEAAAPTKRVALPANDRSKPTPRQDEHRKPDNPSHKSTTLATPAKSPPKTQRQSLQTTAKPASEKPVNSSAASKARTLAFMKRAASIRRGGTD